MMRSIDPLDCPILKVINLSSPLHVIDVGAAGGIDPVWRDFCLKGNGHAFGFEPFPENFEKLSPARTISYFPWAISDRVGEAEFFGHKSVGSLSRREDREQQFDESYEKIHVKTETLANLRKTGKIPSIDVLKIDVEGHELDVLRGARNYLDEVLYLKAEFTFEQSQGNSFADIDKLATGHGMQLFEFASNYTSYNALHGGDVLYLRDVTKLAKSRKNRKELRELILKLVTVALINNQFPYAYYCCCVAEREKIILADEFSELEKFCTAMVYKPVLLGNFPGKFQLCRLIFNASLLFAGKGTDKTAPKDSRLQKSLRMWTGENLLLSLFRSKAKSYWQRIYDIAQ